MYIVGIVSGSASVAVHSAVVEHLLTHYVPIPES